MANYIKQTWTDGSGATPLSAARMGVIETGVFDRTYPPAARVTHNAAQSITTATLTALAFNTEIFDTESNAASTIHDTVTNNSRLTCRTAGIYEMKGGVQWASNATGVRELILRVNGTSTIQAFDDVPVSGSVFHHVISSLYQLAVNDYVELVVFQTSGGNLNVNSSSPHSPSLMMVRVA